MIAGLYDESLAYGCDLTFILDKNLNLISSTYSIIIDVPVYIINKVHYFNGIEQTTTTYYYRSDSEWFSYGTEEINVNIPTYSEENFIGYNLLS